MNTKSQSNKNYFSRVCIVGPVYTLLYYLLNSTVEEIDHTFFFVSEGLPLSVRKNLPHYYLVKKRKKTIPDIIFRSYLRFFSNLRWPFLKNTPIYALDHMFFSSAIIGKKSYTLLEDAPFIASFYFDSASHKQYLKKLSSGWRRTIIDFFFGPVFLRPFGENPQCKEIIFSENDYPASFSNKKIQINSLDYLWNQMNKEKKDRILAIFNLTDDDINLISSKPTIILTQPFFNEHEVTKEEHIQIYANIIKQYPPEEIILKTHARDHIPYRKYFPDIAVFDKPIPIQLFNLLDIRFRKAVTTFSSAILSFPYDLEIEWLGTKVHPKLFAIYGEIKMPQKKDHV